MGEDIENILRKTEKRIKERREEWKYEQPYLEDLEINEAVNVSDDAFLRAKKIKAKDVKSLETAFCGASYCEAEKVEAARTFEKARFSNAKYVKAVVAFAEAKNSGAERVEAEKSAFYRAENCPAGYVEAITAFSAAKSCDVDTVKAISAFEQAKLCKANKIYIKWDAFDMGAEKCLVDDVQKSSLSPIKNRQTSLGKLSRGIVILGNAEVDRIFPSVVLMKDRVKDGPEEVKEFFEKELEKARKGEENIFDALSYFNWEGKTLEKGNKKLKERHNKLMNMLFDKFKEEQVLAAATTSDAELRRKFNLMLKDSSWTKSFNLLQGLENSYFYCLVDDNSKRQEIFEGFLKLEKREKNSLAGLNNHLSKFTDITDIKDIKENLNLLSLKDWVKCGDYAEFLDFDKAIIEDIKQGVEKVELGEVIENPNIFKNWKTARMVKQFERLGKRFNTQQLIQKFKKDKRRFEKVELGKMVESPDEFKNWKTAKKIKQFEHLRKKFNAQQLMEEFEKEKRDKINSGIKEYILTSSEENLDKYLEELGCQGEKNDNIVFAARLHKVLSDRGETKNAEVLEQLIRGKKPLDFEENKKWLDGMKDKFDTQKWLEGKQKDYEPVIEKDYSASLEKNRIKQLNEIIAHFEEIGIEVKPEMQEIEKIFSAREKEMPPDIRKDIKTHIQTYQSLFGIEKSLLPKKIILETEENPLKTIQMGEKVVGSCLAIKGGHEESAICNAADINKKIVWAKNKETKDILGRVLIAINEEGELERFAVFNNDPRLNLEPLYDDFVFELTKELEITIGHQGKIKELIGENWYDDRAAVPLGGA